MYFLKIIALCFLYFIAMSKLGIKLDTLESALVGGAIALLLTKDNKEDTQ